MSKKKAAKKNTEVLDFNHPVCHFVNGERLYYVLFTVKTHVFKVGSRIIEALESCELSKSSCGYYLFGASDILLRLWASEDRLNKFKKALLKIEDFASQPEFYLISSMETWYQRHIEADPAWMESLDSESIERIKSGEVPENLTWPSANGYTVSQERKLTRFFVFVQDDSGKNETLMADLRARFANGEDELFNARHRISLYSAYTDNFTGVLVKGETVDFPKVAPMLVRFAQEQKDRLRYTTTCICSGSIKTEGNSLCEPGQAQTPTIPRGKIILRNLLISHGCNHEIIEEDTGRKHAAEHFVSLLSERVEWFFILGQDWARMVRDFRFLFKWCVLRDNDQLHAFLMRHYAKVEHELREIIWPAYSVETIRAESDELNKLVKRVCKGVAAVTKLDGSALESVEKKVRDVIEPTFRTIRPGDCEPAPSPEEAEEEKRRQLTLGAIAVYVDKRKKHIGGGEQELCAFVAALQNCSTQRNLIAHGSLQELVTSRQKEKTFPWEEPVVNYIKLMLLWPRIVPLVREYVSRAVATSGGGVED